MSGPDGDHADPVVAAARGLVAALGLTVREAYLWRVAGDDDGRGPLRTALRIGYPRAAGEQGDAAEQTAMADRLVAAGWAPDPGFRSHGRVLVRGGVRAILLPQNASTALRSIELLGPDLDQPGARAFGPRPVRLH